MAPLMYSFGCCCGVVVSVNSSENSASTYKIVSNCVAVKGRESAWMNRTGVGSMLGMRGSVGTHQTRIISCLSLPFSSSLGQISQ